MSTGPVGDGPADPSPREGWVDVAKGGAIVLVVLYHASVYSEFIDLSGPWFKVGMVLASVRMPLFFFTAGIFAAGALRTSFRELGRRRLARLMWLYLLWSVIAFAVFQVAPNVSDTPPTVRDLLLVLVRPTDSSWFLYALVLFFTACWLMRRWPVGAQLAPAVVLALLVESDVLTSGSGPLDRTATNFVFFLAAVHAGPGVRRLAPHVRWWHVAVLTTAFLVAVELFYRGGLGVQVPGGRLLANLAAIASGVSAAMVASRSPLSGWLRRLGAVTLPVYLLHFYAILMLCAALRPVADALAPVTLLVPPVLTVLGVLVSLAVHRLTRRVPGLYALPPVRRRGSLSPEGARSSPAPRPL